MRFSVVVPFRNTKRYMDACIRSLLDQRYPKERYEILLVDNASTDGSAEAARSWPEIRVLHQPRIGSYAARNLGLEHARGDIIAFTDSDCAAAPDWLAAFDRALSDPAVGVVLGHRESPATGPALKWLEAFERHKADWLFASPDGARYYAHTNNMAVRASLFDELGPFVEILRGADVLWVQQAVRKHSHEAVCFAPDALVRHLEMTSLAQHFRKKWIYGRSSRRNRGTRLTNQAVSNAERMQIFRRTVAAEHYGWAKASALLLLLTAGGVCYDVAARLPTWQAAPERAPVDGSRRRRAGNSAGSSNVDRSPAGAVGADAGSSAPSPSPRADRAGRRPESEAQ